MRVRNWITDAWRRVSLRNGFEEYDAPIFEYLDLFTVKSGQEIAEQLFRFTDRGGRDLAIRPEITPSLARMVNARIHSLPRPIKWFSAPRLCRAERPQRGRLREFFQWNVDVIGSDSVLADAECIFTCIDFLREVGLTPDDVKVHIGSRPLVMALLASVGVGEGEMDPALLALDKRQKIAPEAFEKMLADIGMTAEAVGRVCRFMDAPYDEQTRLLGELAGVEKAHKDLQALDMELGRMGVGEYVTFDFHIVRGLAYYTGVVYEAIAAGERAVAGGGRYDNLLEVLGGPQVGATGFGMGDVVLSLLLEEKGKIPEEVRASGVEFFCIATAEGERGRVLEAVGRLRSAGRSSEFSYKATTNLGKLLKEAARRGAAKAVIVAEDGTLSVKDLATGEQTDGLTLEQL